MQKRQHEKNLGVGLSQPQNMKRSIIPYNANTKQFAGGLRSNMTFSEVRLWQCLKRGKMLGYDFDRQRPIGNYIVDFYCKDLQLAIEVDGITHESDEALRRDKIRQAELEKLSVSFLRFNALLVLKDVEAVLKAIATWIEDFEKDHGVPEGVKKKREKS